MTLLLITDALLQGEGHAFVLHPALDAVRVRLARMRRKWFHASLHNPLGWYGALVEAPPAALLAARSTDLPGNARQVWVASPFHAMLGRDTVRLLPEVEFPWTDADSAWLCDALNPLLQEDRMSLHACGSAMLLASKAPLDASPVPFAAIAGGLLPNRNPEGKDGGRLMRLLAEIQMILHNQQQPTRFGQPAVHGLWFWGAGEMPYELPVSLPPVATRNPVLQALEHAHGAELTITEAEHVSALLADNPLPKAVVLAGSGHAVILRKALIPRFDSDWQAGFAAPEVELFNRLRLLTDAL